MPFHYVWLPALALAGIASSPAAAVDVSGELGVVSDYRYRGMSLSNGKPAAQGSVTLEHGTGLYASAWASTVNEPDFDAQVELDIAAGYAVNITEQISFDVSATSYVYPGEASSNYVELTMIGELDMGTTTTSAGISYVPRQRGTRDENGNGQTNAWLFVGVDHELSSLPLTLSARLGHERGYFDEVNNGGKWDWCISASAKLGAFRVGAAYDGSSASSGALSASLFLEL